MNNFKFDSNELIAQSYKNINIANTELSDLEFDGCTFTACDLSNTEFTNCRFIDCQFNQCNLSNVKIAYCKFNDVEFSECKMVGIDWTRVSWPNIVVSAPISLTKCIINDSSFFGLKLRELIVKECKAHDVDFRETDLSEANLSYTDLAHSMFNNTNLTDANFSEAVNYTIDVSHNKITGAKFSRYEAANLLTGLGIELVD